MPPGPAVLLLLLVVVPLLHSRAVAVHAKQQEHLQHPQNPVEADVLINEQRSSQPRRLLPEQQMQPLVDADTFGGMQRFSLPVHLPCRNNFTYDGTIYGFGKCLLHPTTSDHQWRFILSWHSMAPLSSDAPMHEQLHQFGVPGNCPVPQFSLSTNLSSSPYKLKVGRHPCFAYMTISLHSPSATGAKATWDCCSHWWNQEESMQPLV